MTNGLIQHITVEESTSIQWVKSRPHQGKATVYREVNWMPQTLFSPYNLEIDESVPIHLQNIKAIEVSDSRNIQGNNSLMFHINTDFHQNYGSCVIVYIK